MKGSMILVTPNPGGRFIEGRVKASTTVYPGTHLQISSYDEVSGRPEFTLWDGTADGERDIDYVALDDPLQGRIHSTAYSGGENVRVYCPEQGDELNMALQDVAGTADAHTAGEKLIVDKGTGELIATTGTPESEPWRLLEDVAAPTARTWAWCRYTGK